MKYPQRSQSSLHFRSVNRKLHTGQYSIGSTSSARTSVSGEESEEL